MQLPSASNASGTLLGALAGAAVAASLPSLPFIITAAATLGMTPIGLAGIAAMAATSLVNLAATHIASVKGFDNKVSNYWPLIKTAANIQIENSYPVDKTTNNP